MSGWHRFHNSELAQDLVEYVLALVFVVLLTTAVLVSTGDSLQTLWHSMWHVDEQTGVQSTDPK